MKSDIKALIELENEVKRSEFFHLGSDLGAYSKAQKEYAINQAQEIGVRATARLLGLQRKTIQRWLRDANVEVDRYPSWLHDWAERKQRKRERWRRIYGYNQ